MSCCEWSDPDPHTGVCRSCGGGRATAVVIWRCEVPVESTVELDLWVGGSYVGKFDGILLGPGERLELRMEGRDDRGGQAVVGREGAVRPQA